MKNKTSNSIETSLTKIFDSIKKEFNKTPLNLTADNEFDTTYMKRLKEKYGFKLYLADPYEKFRTGNVERFFRTMRNLIKRYVYTHDDINYINVLQDLIYNYNTTKHRSIGITPTEAIKFIKPRKMSKEYDKIFRPEEDVVDKDDMIGEFVRVRLKLGQLAKGDKPRFSSTIYEVIERDRNRFRLKDAKTGAINPKLYNTSQLQVITHEASPKPEVIEPEASPEPSLEPIREESPKIAVRNIEDVIKRIESDQRFKRRMARHDIDETKTMKEESRPKMIIKGREVRRSRRIQEQKEPPVKKWDALQHVLELRRKRRAKRKR